MAVYSSSSQISLNLAQPLGDLLFACHFKAIQVEKCLALLQPKVDVLLSVVAKLGDKAKPFIERWSDSVSNEALRVSRTQKIKFADDTVIFEFLMNLLTQLVESTRKVVVSLSCLDSLSDQGLKKICQAFTLKEIAYMAVLPESPLRKRLPAIYSESQMVNLEHLMLDFTRLPLNFWHSMEVKSVKSRFLGYVEHEMLISK